MFNLILMPAYGRHYETNSEAMSDWSAGKDFRIVGTGPYCSIRDVTRIAKVHNNVVIHSNEGGFYVVKANKVVL